MDCLFCKIIAGDVPAEKVYEDAGTLAFLDIHPINPGHTLVVPKNHAVGIAEVESADLQAVMATIKKIAPAVVAGVGADAYNIGINQGAAAGQVIMHLHVHIMPRFATDGHKLWHGTNASAEERAAVGEKIRAAMSV